MKQLLISLLIVNALVVHGQKNLTPLQKNDYSKFTSYQDLTGYIYQIEKYSRLLKVEIIGQSVQDRNLYVLKFSSSIFGKDPLKIKVLLFAQQHGNEQSGKEGTLFLIQELIKPENKYLFDRIDLAIVPQMNPDGSEVNKRLNGNEMDLNRNHLILTEQETIALHKLFDRYLFEVTMDVHEYYPYGEAWKKTGYHLNTDEFIGPTNNPNISEDIKSLSNGSFLPFIKKYFSDRHFSSFIYSPGGPPGVNYIRHSTFDINDGRQSFGILNSFSFIQEGLNGKDYSTDNIKKRAEGQMTGMRGLLEYVFNNKEEIKAIVSRDRMDLKNNTPGKRISIQCEHAGNGKNLELPVHSYSSGTDSIITIIDYRPVVKSITDVKSPEGYLIPKKNNELIRWVNRHNLIQMQWIKNTVDIVEEYKINAIDSIDFEGDKIVNPSVSVKHLQTDISANDYIYVPTSQLKGEMVVIALEPKSMLGLVTYKHFAHLLKNGEAFPILRVVKKK